MSTRWPPPPGSHQGCRGRIYSSSYSCRYLVYLEYNNASIHNNAGTKQTAIDMDDDIRQRLIDAARKDFEWLRDNPPPAFLTMPLRDEVRISQERAEMKKASIQREQEAMLEAFNREWAAKGISCVVFQNWGQITRFIHMSPKDDPLVFFYKQLKADVAAANRVASGGEVLKRKERKIYL